MVLLDDSHAVWEQPHDAALVWTRPDAAIPSFRELAEFRVVRLERILAEVDEFATALMRLRDRVTIVLVPTWTSPPHVRGLGPSDLRPGGLGHALAAMNLRVLDRLASVPNLFALDTRSWLVEAGARAMEPSFWYMAKLPFAPQVFARAAAEAKSALVTARKGPRKLLVLDLDDVLWGGIVGEDGTKGLRLGGHDPVGEAFADFQRTLKALHNRGVLLAIASRNDEAVALDAIRTHPEMVLRENDFVAHRIDWRDKAGNIAELTAELGLGLDSVVFIDDSPAERARVREALPEVFVPEWPVETMRYAQALSSLRCFDTLGLTNEDRERGDLYRAEHAREAGRRAEQSAQDWLRSLDLVVQVEEFGERNLKRIAQLVNKTNQMNLTTRRHSEAELQQWCREPQRRLWSFRAADRFGDSGLIGVLSVEAIGERLQLVDFLLSCRVVGRGIELLMIHQAVKHATEAGLSRVVARHVPSERNRPCLEFWKSSGFLASPDGHTFEWDTREPFAAPDALRVEYPLSSESCQR